MDESKRLVTCGANVEVIVKDVTSGKVRHQFNKHNQMAPLGILMAGCHHNSVNAESQHSWDRVLLSSAAASAPTDPTDWTSGTFYKDLYTDVLYSDSSYAYTYYDQNTSDVQCTITSSGTTYTMPLWIKINATFKAPFAAANETEVKSLVWFSYIYPSVDYVSSYSNRQCAGYTVAFLVLDPADRFTKTASDVVYINWTFTWDIPNRLNNFF